MKNVIVSPLKTSFKKDRPTWLSFVFFIVFAAIAALCEDHFFSNANIRNIVRTVAPMILVAYAQGIALMLGGIDLSIGAIMSVANVICATRMTDDPSSVLPAILLSLAVGAVVGGLNGVLITKGKLQPIILTVATAISIGGIALYVLKAPGGGTNKGFYQFLIKGAHNFMPLILAAAVFIVLELILSKTRFGRQLYAVGGNVQSAIATGIHVDRVKILAFVLIGVLSAMAGIFVNAWISSGDPTCGTAYTQKSIVAAALGGISMAGGKGKIVGCISGAFILIIINNILNLIGITTWYQYIIQAVLLVLAVVISNLQVRSGN